VAPAPAHARGGGMPARYGRRFGGRSMRGAQRFGGSGVRGAGALVSDQLQGRWSLTETIFAGAVDQRRRLRTLAELLLERYGVLTREQVLAEGIVGGFSMLYGALSELETLGVCRRGYFVEGLGGAQFALPGAVERLRAGRSDPEGSTLVLAAVDPAQPYGATLPWPRREGQARGPARVAGAYVVCVDSEPILYLERGGRGIVTLAAANTYRDVHPGGETQVGGGMQVGGGAQVGGGKQAHERAPLAIALRALADAVRSGRIDAVALERVDGEPAIGSRLEPALAELGFRQGPRRLTLRA
ncbi:MAG: hypothetical protein WBQ21_05190, partial [Solirubrobacteraceae bacterium]